MECPNNCGEIIVQEEVGGLISIDASKGLYFFQVILKFICFPLLSQILFELRVCGGIGKSSRLTNNSNSGSVLKRHV